MIVVVAHADHERALRVPRPPRALADAAELLLERRHGGAEVELELLHVARAQVNEGILPVAGRRKRRRIQVGHLGLARQAVGAGLHHRHHVQPQQRQVVQVVGRERLAPQVRVHQAQTTEPPGASAQATDVGQHQLAGIADDDVADAAVAGKEHSDLAADLRRHGGEMARQLAVDHPFGRHAPAEGALERLALRRGQSLQVAADGLSRDGPFSASRGRSGRRYRRRVVSSGDRGDAAPAVGYERSTRRLSGGEGVSAAP